MNADMNVTETTLDDCQKKLSDEAFVILSDFYVDLTPRMVDHVVSEFLAKVASRLREGQPLILENLGELIPCQINGERHLRYHPDPILLHDLPGRPHQTIRLADRRTQTQEVTA